MRSHRLLFASLASISRGRKAERRTPPLPLLQKLGEGEALFKTNAKLRLNKIALLKACPSVITRTYSVKEQDIKLSTIGAFLLPGPGKDSQGSCKRYRVSPRPE